MPKTWDDSIKRLVREHPQDFVTWLIHDATYIDALSIELKNWTRESDFLLAVDYKGQELLLHIEMQTRECDDMAQRMLEYNVLAKREHNRPVHSCIIYLREDKNVTQSPLVWSTPVDVEVLRFHFDIIKLWELTAEELIQTGLPVLLPLLPLTKDGKEPATVDIMIEEIVASQQSSLMTWAKIFSGLAFTRPADKEWLERRFAMYEDILDDSWVVQEIRQKAELKGKTEGKTEGKIEGKIEDILTILQQRFPDLSSRGQQLISQIHDDQMLQKLLVTVALAPDKQTILQAIQEISSEE